MSIKYVVECLEDKWLIKYRLYGGSGGGSGSGGGGGGSSGGSSGGGSAVFSV